MRSRTRNRPLLLSVLTFIAASALLGDDYYIGYRFSTHDAQAFHETLSISKSMTPCHGIKTNDFILLSRQPHELLDVTLRQHEEEFFTFASQQSLNIQSHQMIGTQMHNSTDTLTLPTHCYAVEFNDESARITLVK